MTDFVQPAGFASRPAHGPLLRAIFNLVDSWPPLAFAVTAAATLGLLFQVGHFYEHAAQVTIWILGDYSNICGRDTPWMSPWVTEWVRLAGVYLFPHDGTARQMMLGMELLHLVANFIFLSSIACLYYVITSKWVRRAFVIEGLHLCEHLALTLTAYYVGYPIGVSTLFGHAGQFGGREFAVGYRVVWHFLLNLLPMPFCMIALMDYWHPHRKDVALARALRGTGSAPLTVAD
ncbi:MAG: hypothetical protein JSR61_01135 [Proteobacteria bacterium]|nr:hypothetical protein [Pseudomonadota bacterium]